MSPEPNLTPVTITVPKWWADSVQGDHTPLGRWVRDTRRPAGAPEDEPEETP